MRRLIAFSLITVMLLGLCACGRTAVTESEAYVTQAASAAQTQPPAEPTLSPGAAETAYRSYRFQKTADGTLYTCLVRTDGAVCLYDILPEGVGYIVRFIVTEEGVYATVKEAYFSLDPAALYFFPADGGEPQLLAADTSPKGDFLLADDAVFYMDGSDEALCRLDLASGETAPVLEAPAHLLDVDGGFIYYVVYDDVYRNDSTFGAASALFSGAVSYAYAQDGRIADLALISGAPYIELRGPDGSLLRSIPLDEVTDNFLCADGRIYVPQESAKAILILDLQTGEALERIPLPDQTAYCLLWHADSDAVYYQTYADGEGEIICRADADGAQVIGPLLTG